MENVLEVIQFLEEKGRNFKVYRQLYSDDM